MSSDAAVLADIRRRIKHAKDEGINYVRMPLDNAEDIVKVMASRKSQDLTARAELDEKIINVMRRYPIFVRPHHLWEVLSCLEDNFHYTVGQVTGATVRLVKAGILFRSRVPTEPDTESVRLKNIAATSGKVKGPMMSPATIHSDNKRHKPDPWRVYTKAITREDREFNQLLRAVILDDNEAKMRAVRGHLIPMMHEDLEATISKTALY